MRNLLFTAAIFLTITVFPQKKIGSDRTTEVPDSVLFNMSMRLYDSLTTDSFFKMYKDALRISKDSGSERYYITTQRMLVSRYSALKDIPAFIEESDKIISECQKSETEIGQTLLYETWNFKADRLDTWGMKDEAIRTAGEMSEYAEKHQQMKGLAMAQYLYGGFYLNAHQLEEAESSLVKAWNICAREDYSELMVRVGFSRQSVLINEERYDEALAVADTVRSTISRRAAAGKRIAPGTRLKLAEGLCSIYSRLGDMKNAELQRDTMMMWYAVDPDRSQLNMLLHTDATFKYYSGRYEEAIEVLDSLVRIAERRHNWAQIANNTYALASAQIHAGMKDEAIASFERYAEAKDSAIVQDSREKLDELTKKYELAELSLTARKAKSRTGIVLAASIILLLVVGFYIFYTRRLLEKNRILYEKVRQSDEKEEEVSRLSVNVSNSPLARIYSNVTEIMIKKKPFKNPGLNRESLASYVGTNSKYLADSVKKFGNGRTVNELINWWRIQEAARLLSEDENMSVAEIGEESGFGSSQTFFRLFKEHYGMTPSDFRESYTKSN